MIAIFMLSNEVANVSSERSEVIVNAITNSVHVSLPGNVLTFLTRKAAHIFMYFVLGMLMYNIVKDYGFTTRRAICLSILFSLTYAGSDEFHQLFVQGRSSEIGDILIDTTASSVGIGLYYLLQRINLTRGRLLKLAQKTIGVILVISYIFAVYSVICTNMIPIKYLIFIIPITSLVVISILFANFTKKLSLGKNIAIAVFSVLIIAANVYVYSVSSATMAFLNAIQENNHTNNIVKVDTAKPFVLYISGIDTYGDISTVSRSDVNIMVVVNPRTHQILLVSTPRDYYVQLHGTTGIRDKLTHSGIYGIDMSVKTMEDLYGTPINYYMRINFSSLTKIIDTLGGVDVNSQYQFTAGGYSFNVGINHLNGKQALAFSRERHSFEEGDRTRGSNQELVIEAIIAKMNDSQTIFNYQQILTSLQNTIQTDMGSDSIMALVKNQLDSMSKWSVESISVNGADSHNYTYSMGNVMLYVMEPDVDSLNFAKIKIQQYIDGIIAS